MRAAIPVAMAFLLCVGSLAHGQVVSTGTITGAVRDSSGAPVPQAIVELSGDALIGGARRVPIALDGTYHAPALPAGVYTIEATTPGFAPLRRVGVQLVAGGSAVIDVTFDAPGLTETVIVAERALLVDVRSAASTTTLPYEFLSQLPVSRSVSSLINLTPGISADVSFGASRASNALYVDGVDTTDSRFQDPLARFNFNWIQATQVAALGAGAEYSGFTGVVANSTLKSGGNQHTGMAEYWTIRPNWMGRNTDDVSAQLQKEFTPRTILTWWEANANAGGPLVSDRVWYFGGVQRSRHDDRPAGFTGPGSRDEREWQALIKSTAALTRNIRAEGFFDRGDMTASGDGVGPFTPLEASYDFSNRQTTWNGRLMRATDGGTVLEVRTTGGWLSWLQDPHAPNTRSGPPPRFEYETGSIEDNADLWAEDRTRRATAAGTMTHHVDRFLGRHEFSAGAEFARTASDLALGFPGGRVNETDGGTLVGVTFWEGERLRSTTHRVSSFLQDRWSLGRLTFAPGIRVDANRAGIPANGSVFAATPWSPRVGVAWDVTSSHDTVVRAHYGRYHDTTFSDPIGAADASASPPQIAGIQVDGIWVPSTTPGPQQGVSIDPDLKQSYADQYLIGIERQLPGRHVLTAQLIARHFDSFMGFVAVGQAFEQVQRMDPGPDGLLATADDGGLITVFKRTQATTVPSLYTNPEGLYNDYRALQFIHKHLGSALQIQSSYTWSRNEGWVGNRWHVNAARFDLGNRFLNPNGLINGFGRAHYDPTHEAKVLAATSIPRIGVTVSGTYRYTTGFAWGRRVQFGDLGANFPGNIIRIEPIGTRRLPALNQLDFRVEKTVHSGPATVGVFLEGFNVWNQGIPAAAGNDSFQDLSGRTFGQPRAWSDPRYARAAIRVAF